MNIDEILTLVQAVSDSKLTSFKLDQGDMHISLKKEKEEAAQLRTEQEAQAGRGRQELAQQEAEPRQADRIRQSSRMPEGSRMREGSRKPEDSRRQEGSRRPEGSRREDRSPGDREASGRRREGPNPREEERETWESRYSL